MNHHPQPWRPLLILIAVLLGACSDTASRKLEREQSESMRLAEFRASPIATTAAMAVVAQPEARERYNQTNENPVSVSVTKVEAPVEPMYMLKLNWMKCQDERDVIDLADTVMGQDYLRVLMEKIVTGACTKPALFIMRVTAVVEQRTAKGRTYYCLNVLTPDGMDHNLSDGTFKVVVEKERTCVLPYMLTTVDAELSSRTGDFKIIVEDESHTNASCIEGGRVQITRNNGELLRSVFDLPWKRPRLIMEIPVRQDVSTAIREGCKGADVR